MPTSKASGATASCSTAAKPLLCGMAQQPYIVGHAISGDTFSVSMALSLQVKLTAAQTVEVWNAPSHTEGFKLIARIAKLPDFDDEPATTIWVESMYQWLLFGKENQLTVTKTLALFGVMTETQSAVVGPSLTTLTISRLRDSPRPLSILLTHPPTPQPCPHPPNHQAFLPHGPWPDTNAFYCHLCQRIARWFHISFCRVNSLWNMPALRTEAAATTIPLTKVQCLRFFADQLLAATKALPPADRFTRPEVQLVTDHFKGTYMPTIRLQQYVFTRPQVSTSPCHSHLGCCYPTSTHALSPSPTRVRATSTEAMPH